MKIKRILFPTDFSVYSEKAREYTIYLGEELNASIYIIHAIEPLEYPGIDEEIKKFYKELEKQMERKIEDEREIFGKKGVKAQTNIIIGPRWRVNPLFSKDFSLIFYLLL